MMKKTYHGPMRIAHRGVTQYAPENTLGGFVAALDIGIEAIEIDIKRTKDGKIAVIHDANLTRLTLGHPTKFSNAVIADMTWEELAAAELPYANHLLLNFPQGGYENEFLALNLEVLLGQDSAHPYARELEKDGRMAKIMLFKDFMDWVETTPKNFVVEVEYKALGMMEELHRIFSASTASHKCILFSGVSEQIDEIQDFYKTHEKPNGLKLGANIRYLSPENKARMENMDLYEIGLNDGHITKEDVDYLNERNIKIFSNLGDFPKWWKTICDLNIAGFKTNYPEEFTKWWEESYSK